MNFECKYCGDNKYRQISPSIKQCASCGRQTLSEGTVDENIDFIEEEDKESNEILKAQLENINWDFVQKLYTSNGLFHQTSNMDWNVYATNNTW